MKINQTVFHISKMDCPSEENMIRMKLEEVEGIKKLDFDIPSRNLTVLHQGNEETLIKAIDSLQLGGEMTETKQIEDFVIEEDNKQRRLLWIVLVINFSFFIIEMLTGFFSKSMGLVADSLDMLADAFVYGLSLMAVGAAISRKKRVALIAGYFQIILAIIGFSEVVRRFIMSEAVPDFGSMIIVSILALIANGACLVLLQRSKSKNEAHMKASLIFTSNDVIINLGVILAGGLVFWLNSAIPDLLIGGIVFVIVLRGALRILKLGK